MPWIEKRGRSRVVRWKTYAPDGTVTVHASGALTEPEARALVDQLRAKLPDRRKRKPGVRIADPGIISLCEQWAAAKVAAEPQSANYATEAAAVASGLATSAGILYLSQATGAKIRELREAKATGVDRPLAYLRAIIRWAQDELGVEVDPRFYPASRPRQSRESEARLLTPKEVAAIEARALDMGQRTLMHCLLTYGWRPITACRILVSDVDLASGKVRLRIKHQKNPHYHPLFPTTIQFLRSLMHKREPDERLFLSRSGIPWPCKGDNASRLVSWYSQRFTDLAPGTGGTNALKRWAVHRMERGLPPWPRPLTLREIRLFTGHRTDSQVTRYRRVSAPEAEALVRGSSMVVVGQSGASQRTFTPANIAQIDLSPDESMDFST